MSRGESKSVDVSATPIANVDDEFVLDEIDDEQFDSALGIDVKPETLPSDNQRRTDQMAGAGAQLTGLKTETQGRLHESCATANDELNSKSNNTTVSIDPQKDAPSPVEPVAAVSQDGADIISRYYAEESLDEPDSAGDGQGQQNNNSNDR